MKVIFTLFLLSLICNINFSQNVGIGTTTPTHTLHIEPSLGNNPLRVNGLNQYNTERNLFIVDPTTGVVKHIHVDSLASVITGGLGTDDQNIDSLALNGNILTVYIENGNPASIDLTPIAASGGTDDQNIDSLTLTGTTLTVYIENGTSANIDLSSLQDGTGTDDQNLQTPTLSGTILNTNIENGASTNIDLQPIIDSAIANSSGTDDQMIDNFSLSGTTLTLEIENDGQAPQTVNLSSLQDGTGTDDQNLQTPTLSGTILTTNIENGASTNIDLQPIIDSAIANSSGTDDQMIDNFSLSGTTLTLEVENDGQAPQTVNLSSLQDGTGTDDQMIDNFSLSGTTLTLEVENDGQAPQTVNLSSLQDGTGTDDQNLLTPTLTGTILNTNIENGASTSIDLQPIIDSAIANSSSNDDQDIDSVTIRENITNQYEDNLSVYIENGASSSTPVHYTKVVKPQLGDGDYKFFGGTGGGTYADFNKYIGIATYTEYTSETRPLHIRLNNLSIINTNNIYWFEIRGFIRLSNDNQNAGNTMIHSIVSFGGNASGVGGLTVHDYASPTSFSIYQGTDGLKYLRMDNNTGANINRYLTIDSYKVSTGVIKHGDVEIIPSATNF